MCLAIGYKDQAQQGALARLWWKLAIHPVRLFVFSALLHSAVLLLLLQMDRISYQGIVNSSAMPVLLIAVPGGALLGVLFEKLPVLLATSGIDYNVFGSEAP